MKGIIAHSIRPAARVIGRVALHVRDLSQGHIAPAEFGEMPIHTVLRNRQRWRPTSACVEGLAPADGIHSVVELLVAEHRLDMATVAVKSRATALQMVPSERDRRSTALVKPSMLLNRGYLSVLRQAGLAGTCCL